MHKHVLTTAFAVLALAAGCLAQQPESLLITPGDQLHIQVFDTPEMDQHVRVTDSGEVPLMFVGKLKVSELTPGDAARAIETALIDGKYMQHPQVAVTVEDYQTQVSVLGQVKSAGTFDIMAPTTILSILSMAGGLTEFADRHIAIERHSDPNQKIAYFVSNTSDEALANSVIVNPGDTVLVPRAGVVYVLGDVGRPGGYPMTNDDSQITVLQALALAGAADKTAVLKKAKLIRRTPTGPQEVPLALAEMQKGERPDLAMQSNDVLFIPFSWMKNIAMNSSQIVSSAASAMIYAHP